MKRIIGLDLGTTSIGWAVVDEVKIGEDSSIIDMGVRVVPLSPVEVNNFEQGKSITTNAERTQKRQSRRNRQRYQHRRENLIKCFLKEGWIRNVRDLKQDGNDTTHKLLELRARAAEKKIELRELAQVLLMINKKRGYKSSRKVSTEVEGDGQLIDEIDIALELQTRNITPGEYSFELLQKGNVKLPSFYRSDLINEFQQVWILHKDSYPEILTAEFYDLLLGRGKSNTTKIFYARHNLDSLSIKGKDRKKESYKIRAAAANEIHSLPELIFVLAEVNGNIAASSGYLGAIGDRSKQLQLQKLTVGQLQWRQIQQNPHSNLKNQIFYRQDYMDEFDQIWNTQKQHHNSLNEELKNHLRNYCIFYQRPLKSKKSEIAFCELESKTVEKEGKKVTIGSKVIPRSSPLFQEFKIWSILHNIRIEELESSNQFKLDDEVKSELFEILNIKHKLNGDEVLKIVFGKEYKRYRINYTEIEGNRTIAAFFDAYEKIMIAEGHEKINLKKLNKEEALHVLRNYFSSTGISTEIIEFDSTLKGKYLVRQPFYMLYHLLYSYQGDTSRTGIKSLLSHLKEKFGFRGDSAKIIANISFDDEYGNLSAKAISKMLPHLKEQEYSEACNLAGYNHSKRSLTKEQNEERKLSACIEILRKNSLRNPVVEKILNQMIHVVNALVAKYGNPDEIRIELARDLKQSSAEREKNTQYIRTTTKKHEEIREILKAAPFNIKNASRNDIIKYKLYEELAFNGYKDLYTNTYIPKEKLFSKEFDVEHIIPKAVRFDDSFSNKTLSTKHFNSTIKGNLTAIDCIEQKRAGDLDAYLARVNDALATGDIKPSKHRRLLQKLEDLDEGFLERDLRNSQYIAKKAYEILLEVTRNVSSTIGKITAKLRDDWGLMNIMKEINFQKYDKLGLTYVEERKNGNKIKKIKDWSKRDDHRHHAMDALTVAFTRRAYVQYLNNKSASSQKGSYEFGIEEKYTFKDNGKRRFTTPMQNFRSIAKTNLQKILISYKAKNKVVTSNINKIRIKDGVIKQMTLTPRDKLHEETFNGKSKAYITKMERVNASFDFEKIQTVASESERLALTKRLEKYESNPKKAFTGKNSLKKIPLYTAPGKKIAEQVKTVKLVARFTKRKEIGPNLNLSEMLDKGAKRIIEDYIKVRGLPANKALSDLENYPIWIDKEKGISMKHVKISGVRNAEALREKKDHFGEIMENGGSSIGNDFVSLGNNHHVAIYRDQEGNLQENVVSFYEATHRAINSIDIVAKQFNSENGWAFLFTLKQNEMFVFPDDGFDPNEIDLMDENNKKIISKHLFRVQKISTKNYMFTNHLETAATSNEDLKDRKELIGIKYHFIQSPQHLSGIIKVRIDHLGYVARIGEY